MDEKVTFENRIFKLSTGENASSADLENLIETQCHYVKYVAVGADETDQPVALIFPNQRLLVHPDYKVTPEQGCFCPRNLEELSRCLTGCLKLVNHKIADDTSKVKSAVIINEELTTNVAEPISSNEILQKYKTLLHKTHGENVPSNEEVYFIKNAL